VNIQTKEKKEIRLITQLKSIVSFFWRKDEVALKPISEKAYKEDIFGKLTPKQLERAYEKAWEAKNFEINNYWKRANYFWAFQVASFAGYFGVLGSDVYVDYPEILYYVICIGFVTSLAWSFINIGSKTWQRHWEIHVDLLEEKITGPLYKIVTTEKTYSVSKINEIISRFFTTIWILIGFKYLFENISFYKGGIDDVALSVIFSSILVIYFSASMYHGYGRGMFGNRTVTLFERKYTVNN
jgi:hypothetical protein